MPDGFADRRSGQAFAALCGGNAARGPRLGPDPRRCDAACLEDEAADLRLRFAAAVETRHLDVLDPESFAAVVDGLPVLPDRIIRSNFTGPAAIPAILANGMAARECWWASVRRVGQTRRSCLSRIGGRDWYKTKPASVTSTFASG